MIVYETQEFLKKLHTFDTSYRIFVRQAKSKNRWREKRTEEISQIADKKLNTDVLIGTVNKLKNTLHTEIQTKLNQKFYERKLAIESIAHQEARAERLLQQSQVIQNRSSSQPNTSRNCGNSPVPVSRNASRLDHNDSLVFYHNEPNNNEWKLFLDAKLKLKDIDEKSSKVLYNNIQQSRPMTVSAARSSIHTERSEVTTYQAFIGAYPQQYQTKNNSIEEIDDVHKEDNALSPLENSSAFGRLAARLSVITNQNPTVDIAHERPRSHRGRISNVSKQEFEFSEIKTLSRIIEAKQNLHEQQLRNASPTRGSLMAVDIPRGVSEQRQKDRKVNAKFTRTLNAFHTPSKTVAQQEDLSLHRKKISSKADDRSHEVSNWKNMMNFLPQRVKKAAMLRNSKTIETSPRRLQISPQSNFNGSIGSARGTQDTRKLTNIIHQRNASVSRNQQRESQRMNMSAIVNAESQRQDEDISRGNGQGQPTQLSDDTLIGAFQRTRLFEHNLLLRFKRTGRSRDTQLSPEEERERLLAAYDKYKKFRIKLRATNK